ncbi:MAG: cadmium-translocating P-type ATPase [Vicinamibacteria bacterium]|nr:cadmium-translocating P-type ATPase [Vicinamibacteria bacterium]
MRASATACTVCEDHAESVFKVEGLDCHEEVALIERRFKHLAGLETFSADVVAGRLRVQYDAARLSTNAIVGAVADTGMRAWLEHEEPRSTSTSDRRRWMLLASGASLAVSLAANAAGWTTLAQLAALLTVISGGGPSVRRAWSALRLRTLDMHVLMTVAVIGALAIGEWLEGASVVFLFGLAQYLESRSMDRARHAIRALMDLTPPLATLVQDGHERRVPADDVRIGDHVRVRPGEKLPLDGRVVAGESDVNQAPITGESLPVDKRPGDEVFAGSINGHGALEIVATKLRGDTTLARIIHLVEAAQAERAPSQTVVDRFARVYTPAVMVLAVLVALVPPIAGWGEAGTWLYRALVLLVIACPCALVIATPVAVVSALAAGARRGVLIKGGAHLERLASVRSLAFDKTGTLTRGTPVVSDVVAVDGVPVDDVLRLAAAVNRHSEHPVGRVIVQQAMTRGVSTPTVTSFKAVPGQGAEAEVDGATVLVGSQRLLAARGVDLAAVREVLQVARDAGATTALVARAGRLIGYLTLADAPRESARDVIGRLRQGGVARIEMLTGDGQGAASRVAREVGVDAVRAELLPHDKVEAIKSLRAEWGSVAMVGDGINDAPALAAADVGIVMGAAGSDAALETADVALMGDDLTKLPFTLRLGRAAMRTIHTNIAIALVVKAIFLALAVSGYTSLWLAILADTGTSLVVVANGLRLLRTT